MKSDLEIMSIPAPPYDIKKKMNRIISFFSLFKEQVPDANINTIGRTIHKLLAKNGIGSELPAILQVIMRSARNIPRFISPKHFLQKIHNFRPVCYCNNHHQIHPKSMIVVSCHLDCHR
jgi:hypothetical protein